MDSNAQLRGFLGLLIFLIACSSSCEEKLTPAVQVDSLLTDLVRYNASLRELDGAERGTKVTAFFKQRVEGINFCSVKSLEGFGVDQLENLFRSASFSHVYEKSDESADRVVCLFSALETRGAVKPGDVSDLFGVLVSQRRFAAASEIKARWPLVELEELPKINLEGSSDRWRVLRIKDDLRSASVVSVDLGNEDRVVIIASPFCGFSRKALLSLEQDSSLKWLADISVVVVPPDAHLDVAALKAWDADHPLFVMQPMYKRKDWAEFTSLDTPTFYLVRKGKIQARFEGWPNTAGVEKLHQAYLNGR